MSRDSCVKPCSIPPWQLPGGGQDTLGQDTTTTTTTTTLGPSAQSRWTVHGLQIHVGEDPENSRDATQTLGGTLPSPVVLLQGAAERPTSPCSAYAAPRDDCFQVPGTLRAISNARPDVYFDLLQVPPDQAHRAPRGNLWKGFYSALYSIFPMLSDKQV